MALCDLAGKALNTPSYNLFGGKYSDALRIYLDLSSPKALDDLDEWAALAAGAKSRGYTHIKFDIYYTAPDYTEDTWNRVIPLPQLNRIAERVAAVRQEVGWEIEIAVDWHMHCDVVAAYPAGQRAGAPEADMARGPNADNKSGRGGRRP